MDAGLKVNCLRIVRKHYPDLLEGQVSELMGGHDHLVVVVKQETVFRFTRPGGEIRRGVLNFVKHFSQASPVPIPCPQLHFDEPSGTWYEVSHFIQGVSFYPEVARSFTHAQRVGLAKRMGLFLGALHSFPLERARTMGVGEMDPSTFWLYIQKEAYPHYERVVFPHISKTARDWVRQLFAEYVAAIRGTPFVTTVTHSDMWVFHIIVDPHRCVLSGVIDFATRIADPARDFKAFEHYGRDFVDEVYAAYSLPTGDSFEMRRLFYTGHDMVFTLARSIEAGNANEAIAAEEQLVKYIEAHPRPLARQP
jgi:aminoglycoside phosphotransferase (APT) family kinase protein